MGVPVIIPVELKVKVSGKEVPPPSAQVSVPAPPFAASCKLYGVLRVAPAICPLMATVGGVETVTVVVPEFAKPVSFAVMVTPIDGGVAGAVNVAGASLAV